MKERRFSQQADVDRCESVVEDGVEAVRTCDESWLVGPVGRGVAVMLFPVELLPWGCSRLVVAQLLVALMVGREVNRMAVLACMLSSAEKKEEAEMGG